MLTEQETFELIRQAERFNLSDKELDYLKEWAAIVRIYGILLNCLFDGYLTISAVKEDGPIFDLTDKAEELIHYVQNMNEDEEVKSEKINELTVKALVLHSYKEQGKNK